MEKNLNDQDILLVKEKGKPDLKAVSGVENGELKTAELDPRENNNFLKIDKQGNALENFCANFMNQVKDPTRFDFFKVPSDYIPKMMVLVEDWLKYPNDPQCQKNLGEIRVNPQDIVKGQKQPGYAIDENKVDWSQFERIGISRETLEKTGNLDKILNRQKTDLLPISPKFDDITLRTDARLALRESPDGKLSLSIHALRKEPELDRPYFGVRFSEEDKQNLLKTGNLGRIAEAEYKQGEKTPVYLSIDRQTNELVASRAEKIKIPENIKGVALDGQQKQDLADGKAVWIEGMTSKKGTPFDAYLQFNADKRSFEFRFDNDKKQEQGQKQENKQADTPKTFRKKELSDDQRSSLGEGKTVYVDGLVDKKGKGYSGYITMNKETGKTDFMFPKDYKEALAAGKVIPDDRHKTQVAVNSEGKTNEATKDLKEPLKRGQTNPDEKQATKQEQDKPKKSKGMRM